jgi:hypothetical protein
MNKKCEHNKQPWFCEICDGRGICKHHIHKYSCKKCTGTQICKHGRFRGICRECQGKQICPHNRVRYNCKQCGGFPTLARELLKGAKTRARKDTLPINITKKDILKLIGGGVCPVLGLTYDLGSRSPVDASANLDRIIPILGYIKGNCAVISKLANCIKQNAGSQQIYLVAKWLEKKENIKK